MAVNEATINDVIAIKEEILMQTDDKFDICEKNFNALLKHMSYLTKKVELLEQGLVQHRKPIIEQEETIIYMEDRLKGQELCNVANEKGIKKLRNMFKKFINK